MKSILASAFLIFFSCLATAQQSTCKSRCEEELGVGDSRCNFCKDVREGASKRARKTPTTDATLASAAASSAASSVSTPIVTATPPQSAKKDDAAASSTNTAPVKKNN